MSVSQAGSWKAEGPALRTRGPLQRHGRGREKKQTKTNKKKRRKTKNTIQVGTSVLFSGCVARMLRLQFLEYLLFTLPANILHRLSLRENNDTDGVRTGRYKQKPCAVFWVWLSTFPPFWDSAVSEASVCLCT